MLINFSKSCTNLQKEKEEKYFDHVDVKRLNSYWHILLHLGACFLFVLGLSGVGKN